MIFGYARNGRLWAAASHQGERTVALHASPLALGDDDDFVVLESASAHCVKTKDFEKT